MSTHRESFNLFSFIHSALSSLPTGGSSPSTERSMPPVSTASPTASTSNRRLRTSAGVSSGPSGSPGACGGGDGAPRSPGPDLAGSSAARQQQQLSVAFATISAPLQLAVQTLEQKLVAMSGEFCERIERLERLQGLSPRVGPAGLGAALPEAAAAAPADPAPRPPAKSSAGGTGDSAGAYELESAPASVEQQLRELVVELRTLQQEQQRCHDLERSTPEKQQVSGDVVETLKELNEERGIVAETLDAVRREKLEVIALMHSFAVGKDEVLQELEAVRRSVREESEQIRSGGSAQTALPPAAEASALHIAGALSALPVARVASAAAAGDGLGEDFTRLPSDDVVWRAQHAPVAPSAAAVGVPLANGGTGQQPPPQQASQQQQQGPPMVLVSSEAGYHSQLPTAVAVSPIMRTRSTVCDLRSVPSRPSINSTQVRRFVSAGGIPDSRTAAGSAVAPALLPSQAWMGAGCAGRGHPLVPAAGHSRPFRSMYPGLG
eukprot:TRINITY_DN2338_c0_g1_i1.p1 TRINITY_DN2338_c0_g1~~TRINITY_DN2338_c0_g1_i1.p1  ORF type:complete len:493 (+),score=124.75 TRINITY_DN2338_c0_g1_i1:3-1481(+)